MLTDELAFGATEQFYIVKCSMIMLMIRKVNTVTEIVVYKIKVCCTCVFSESMP